MDTLPMPDMLGDFMDEFNEEVPHVGESDEIAENNVLWLHLQFSPSYSGFVSLFLSTIYLPQDLW